MAQVNATFNVSGFELRNYTDPYLSPSQSVAVSEVETRVNEQLDFLAQMLGWSGPNYWTNLADTPDQKRQLLGGTFGVYNSYVIPKIYEIRNWDNKLVVDRLQFLAPGRQTQVARITLGDDSYQLRSVEVEGDYYVISIGELTDSFFSQIADNVPLKVDVPTYRPAPFRRAKVGISGDAEFICGTANGNLVLYPAYDSDKKFPYQSNVLFSGSVYYFDQPIYLTRASNLLGTPDVLPEYDSARQLWYLQIPEDLSQGQAGIEGTLVWSYSNSAPLLVKIQTWVDPSDWNSENVLNNFRGVWGNKGGDLPFNFVFDALSIHGFDEKISVELPTVERTLHFNDILNFIYSQKTVISQLAPGGAKIGDLWWNDNTGALAVWLPDSTGCAAWVEIDYRNSPQQPAVAQVTFSDVTTFRAAAPTLPKGAIIRINNTIGLTTSDNVLGLKGLLRGSAAVVMTRVEISGGLYWAPDEFSYTTVINFGYDAAYLPFKVPVRIFNAGGLSPYNGIYTVGNLSFTISGDYEVILQKFYENTNWELFPDSILKYIANTALFGGLLHGEMWWDYVNADPTLRSAAIFYTSPHPIAALSVEFPGEDLDDGVYPGVDLVSLTGTGGRAKADITVVGNTVTSAVLTLGEGGDKYAEGDLLIPDSVQYPGLVGAILKVDATVGEAWVTVNQEQQLSVPPSTLDLGVVKFYCDGYLLTANTEYTTENYSITYVEDPADGTYEFTYYPRTFIGMVTLPEIAISDAITSAYRADVTGLVFSGLTYKMTPSVYNSETPLRLWKSQALQVAETLDHLAEDNYINPLLADLNTGPGPENWEKYFVRLPLEYGRNETAWQKVALVCQDFGYWGSSVEPEKMRCPPEDDLPAIYEELFLYDQPIPDYTYVYSEPYLYSNIAYFNNPEDGPYRNAGIYPASDVQFDEFFEAELTDYDALHNRQADVTSAPGKGYGDWLGEYVNINPCVPLTGFFDTDLLNRGVEPVEAPVWDASIYKFAPTCESDPASYSVDANHYKIGYAYFVADASAAEDTFFDITQEAAWRYPVSQPKTSYLTPR